jgi:RsiW-degrading membrane proteinase PrsW (M82 family)
MLEVCAAILSEKPFPVTLKTSVFLAFSSGLGFAAEDILYAESP